MIRWRHAAESDPWLPVRTRNQHAAAIETDGERKMEYAQRELNPLKQRRTERDNMLQAPSSQWKLRLHVKCDSIPSVGRCPKNSEQEPSSPRISLSDDEAELHQASSPSQHGSAKTTCNEQHPAKRNAS